MHISISPVKQIRGRLYLMCVHESTKGSSAKPQLNWAKECEKKQQKTLTPLLFLPAWKRPDDNNVEHGAPVSATDPSSSNALPSLHPSIPPPPRSLKGLHMFMVHACGMTMDSPYKSQQDHGCFKYCSLKTVADKMTAAIFILVREQGHLVGS